MKKSIKALKRYGQNFLVDENIISKIIESFSPTVDDNVIEIGPGQGAITKSLFNKCANFKAVEIDERAIEKLKEKIPSIDVLNSDVLKVDFAKMFPTSNKNVRIIGNIPYNITTDLIHNLIKNRKVISDVYFMLQYEAAKRLTANIGEKDYNALTILTRCFTHYKILFKVSPNSFIPKPNVNSAFVKFDFNKEIDNKVDDKMLIHLVKTLFF